MDNKSTIIIGLIVLAVLGIGGVLWYVSEHPSSILFNRGGTGTATSTSSAPPQKYEVHEKYYDVTALYPGGTPLPGAANAQAVEIMHQFVRTSAEAFKERGNFDNLTQKDIETLPFRDGRKESLQIEYHVKQGPHTVSYIFSMIEDTFGAHPNIYYRIFTFDLRSGKSIDLDDLFTPNTDYLGTLSQKSRAMLPGILAGISGESEAEVNMEFIRSGTQPYPDSFQSWYVDGDALVLLFPPYQVAAYVYGAPEVRLPLKTLPGVAEAYR